MDNKNTDQKSLATHHELFKETCMPFTLRNDSATSQHTEDVILPLVKWQDPLVRYTTLLCFWRRPRITWSTSIKRYISFLWQGLQSNWLKAVIKISYEYVGHVIATGEVQVARTTCEAVVRLQYLTNMFQVSSFLGLYVVHKKCVLSTVHLKAPFKMKLMKRELFRFQADSV